MSYFNSRNVMFMMIFLGLLGIISYIAITGDYSAFYTDLP